MTNYEEICRRWKDIVLGQSDRQNFTSSNKMYGNGDRMYSYGAHFELCRALRDKDRHVRGYLLNGDTYSPTTSKHQGIVRSLLSSDETVIIPYQALAAADIDKDSMELIHTLPDRHEEKHHSTQDRPPGSTWHTEDVSEYLDRTTEEIAEILAARNARQDKDYNERLAYAAAEKEPDGYWSQWAASHDAPTPIIEADLSAYESGPHWTTVGTKQVLRTSKLRYAPEITMTPEPDGLWYEWETSRHWLGESLIRARVTSRVSSKCRTCKGTGRNPEFPDAARYSDQWYCTNNLCSGGVRHRRVDRWAYFLSGFDHQEPRPLYFFCELPKDAKPTTVGEAYEALKPETVLLAEQMGRVIHRQGDIFAVAAPSLDKRTMRKDGATFAKRGNLLGTNHEATEVAYLPGGQTVVRGCLYHNPGFRQPDHVRRGLSEGWFIVVKNAVPLTAGRR